jgi:hypothetical protein
MSAPVCATAAGPGTRVFDCGKDRFLDIFVADMFGRGQLYHNSDTAPSPTSPRRRSAARLWSGGLPALDYDGDGRLDLLVVDMHSDMWTGLDARHASLDLATQTQHQRFRSPLGPTGNERDPQFAQVASQLFAKMGEDYDALLFGNALYHNLGHGKFSETAARAGLETFWPWGVASGDFDNDGSEDVFIPSGMGYPFYYWPNQLMMNNGDGTFRERAGELGIEPPPGGIYLKERIGGQQVRELTTAVRPISIHGSVGIATNNSRRPYFRQPVSKAQLA